MAIWSPDGKQELVEGREIFQLHVGAMADFWIADRYRAQLSYEPPPGCRYGERLGFHFTVKHNGYWSEIWCRTNPSQNYKVMGYLERRFYPVRR